MVINYVILLPNNTKIGFWLRIANIVAIPANFVVYHIIRKNGHLNLVTPPSWPLGWSY